jgi:hypothetical protein
VCSEIAAVNMGEGAGCPPHTQYPTLQLHPRFPASNEMGEPACSSALQRIDKEHRKWL